MLRRRNSTGSTPAAAASTSTCDSRAKTFMFAPGARHGPTPNRCDVGAAASPRAEDAHAHVRHVVEQLRPAVAGEVHVVVPQRDLPGGVHGRRDPDDRRRVERVEEELLLPRVRHLHRPAGRLREARRLLGLAPRALAPEAAAHVGREDPHALRIERERLGEPVAGRERGLRRGPDGEPPVLERGGRRRAAPSARERRSPCGTSPRCASAPRPSRPRRRPSRPGPAAPARGRRGRRRCRRCRRRAAPASTRASGAPARPRPRPGRRGARPRGLPGRRPSLRRALPPPPCRRARASHRGRAAAGSARGGAPGGGRRRRSWPAPVTLSTASRRRGERPITDISDAARSTAFSSSVRVIDCPFARAP